MKFSELNLDPNLMKGIEEAGFEDCMPVQAETFSHTFAGKDVSVQSQTGTGKSATFLISIFNLFLDEESRKGKKALIIAPTRELAMQISREAELLGKYLNFTIGLFYGGVGYTQQEKLLRDGVDIIIGTPGRIIDFNQSGKLNLENTGVLVIDEADRLFDMGFLPDIRRLLRKMPSHPYRQTMLFSATLDSRVKEVASEYMDNPVEIEIEPETVTVENITQSLYHVAKDEKMSLLLGLLRSKNPKNAIIFTNTKYMAERVSNTLRVNGYASKYLMGDLPQNKRQKIIDDVKDGKLSFLVATDVAARGLHVDDLEMVINYDLPENCEIYVHRIGRTARVGKSGTAISLVCEQFVYGLEAIEDYINVKIPVDWAEDSLYADVNRPPRNTEQRRSREGGSRGRSDRYDRSGGSARKQTSTGHGHKKTHAKRKPAQSTTTGSGAQRKSGEKSTVQKKNQGIEKKQQLQNNNHAVEKKHIEKKHVEKKFVEKKFVEKKKKIVDKKKGKKLQDRIEYYNLKYGDNFSIKDEDREKEKPLLKKLSGIFKKKK